MDRNVNKFVVKCCLCWLETVIIFFTVKNNIEGKIDWNGVIDTGKIYNHYDWLKFVNTLTGEYNNNAYANNNNRQW